VLERVLGWDIMEEKGGIGRVVTDKINTLTYEEKKRERKGGGGS